MANETKEVSKQETNKIQINQGNVDIIALQFADAQTQTLHKIQQQLLEMNYYLAKIFEKVNPEAAEEAKKEMEARAEKAKKELEEKETEEKAAE
jgi:hypothetical protein